MFQIVPAEHVAGSISVRLKDAKGKVVELFLNRRIGSPTRETMYLSHVPNPSAPVLLRGPEEAALCGILLRWKASKDTDDWTRQSVQAMLVHLDLRFAATAPAKDSKTAPK